jgi:hypothetical protein
VAGFLSDGGEGGFEVLFADIEFGFSLERDLAGEHFVESDAHGVDIGAVVAIVSHDLFGGHVKERPDGHASFGKAIGACQAGDPKVGQFHLVVLCEQDV